MITVTMGRAGSGKTVRMMQKVGKIAEKQQKSIIIVPEQYSHEAERQLCALCGNSIGLYAEVLSFSRICSRVFSETGKLNKKTLDAGGRILIMHLALNSVYSKLKVYNMPNRRSEFLNGLLEVYDEFGSASLNPDEIMAAATAADGPLGDKLYDLSLIFSAYDALRPKDIFDPKEKLSLLAEDILKSSFGDGRKIFIDGFTDFTGQELEVIDSLVKKGLDIDISLTCDGIDGDDSLFSLPRKTARHLLDIAAERHVPSEIVNLAVRCEDKSDEMAFVEKELFSYENEVLAGEKSENIKIFKCETVARECENAAAEVLRLVRDGGYRYKNIAVVSRNWESYESMADSIFEKYGVPVMFARKSDILRKPIMTLIISALDIIENDWDYMSVFQYLKTGLTGIDIDSRDELENYVLKWNIRGSMWFREEPWTFNPEGYKSDLSERETEALERINKTRLAAAMPLKKFADEFKESGSAAKKAVSLYNFLEDIELPKRIAEKVIFFREKEMLQSAEEYVQLWGILVSALEQFNDVLCDTEIDTEEFIRLFKLLLAQYDVATIPVAADRVMLGNMERVRKRGLKALIVLGATDDNLPKISDGGGVLSDDDRSRLNTIGLELLETAEDKMVRELYMIYSSFTMASEKLYISYPADSENVRPAFVVSRLEDIFGITETEPKENMRLEAINPGFEFAAMSGDRDYSSAATEYFKSRIEFADRLDAVKKAASTPRGSLSKQAAEQLYSRNIRTSASRVDKYYSCRFSYFLQYGLKAKKRKQAEFNAPEIGTFMHYLLENVSSEAAKTGGFGKLEKEDCRRLTSKYVSEYVENVLCGFKDKSGRFKYLFQRLARDAENIVYDMAKELKNSEFEPIDFELDFSYSGDLPPAKISDGKTTVEVNGKVDRVDGWIHDDKLYIRVVDYKTGQKTFNLSDIWYGLGIQMLIYLFSLQKNGSGRYGREIVPSGVLYAPARDVILQESRGITDEELEKRRSKTLVRKGLILDDMDVVGAMEKGDAPKYIPVKFKKDGGITGDSLVSLQQLGLLSRHIEKILLEMGREIENGCISAEPYCRGQMDTACTFCDYFEACHFDEACGDRKKFLNKMKTCEVWEKLERSDER